MQLYRTRFQTKRKWTNQIDYDEQIEFSDVQDRGGAKRCGADDSASISASKYFLTRLTIKILS